MDAQTKEQIRKLEIVISEIGADLEKLKKRQQRDSKDIWEMINTITGKINYDKDTV